MKHRNTAALMLAMILSMAGNPVLAADTTDYSGKYVVDQSKKGQNIPGESTLEVIQNSNAVEVTLVQSGKTSTSHCPFDGSEGEYTSPGGVSGKCRAQLKGKTLIIDSVVVGYPQPASRVRLHTKERWQLSKDGKTLIIKSDVDFPDFPSGVSAAVSGDTSTTTKYKRVDKH